MLNQNNGPLEHLAANTLVLLAGALGALAIQAYGAWMRQRGLALLQQNQSVPSNKEAS